MRLTNDFFLILTNRVETLPQESRSRNIPLSFFHFPSEKFSDALTKRYCFFLYYSLKNVFGAISRKEALVKPLYNHVQHLFLVFSGK